MGNELAKKDVLANRFLRVAGETNGENIGRLLKFTKGHYYVGDDEVAAGREYVAHVNQLARGWVKFEDGKVVEQKLGKIADGFEPAAREELGDTDSDQWEVDSSGNPRDPWVLQYYLPFEDLETGEVVVFVTSSHGGRGAIGKLCNVFARNVDKGSPQIRLGVSAYKHREYGRIETPEFPVVSWTGGADDPKTLANELNDEVPF